MFRRRSSTASTTNQANREFGFSFTRMFVNMWPQFVVEGPDHLSTKQMDRLFDFQIAISDPKRLNPSTLIVMGVTDKERVARKVVDKLIENGILKNDGDTIDTNAITKNFAHQVYMIPQWAQKLLICVLFAWEEELVRWKMFEEEETQIKAIMREERALGGDVGHLEIQLLEMKGVQKLLPSIRSTRQDQRQAHEILPGYEPRRGLVGTQSAQSSLVV